MSFKTQKCTRKASPWSVAVISESSSASGSQCYQTFSFAITVLDRLS